MRRRFSALVRAIVTLAPFFDGDKGRAFKQAALSFLKIKQNRTTSLETVQIIYDGSHPNTSLPPPKVAVDDLVALSRAYGVVLEPGASRKVGLDMKYTDGVDGNFRTFEAIYNDPLMGSSINRCTVGTSLPPGGMTSAVLEQIPPELQLGSLHALTLDGIAIDNVNVQIFWLLACASSCTELRELHIPFASSESPVRGLSILGQILRLVAESREALRLCQANRQAWILLGGYTDLVAYTDSPHADDQESRPSTSEFIVKLGLGAVSCSTTSTAIVTESGGDEASATFRGQRSGWRAKNYCDFCGLGGATKHRYRCANNPANFVCRCAIFGRHKGYSGLAARELLLGHERRHDGRAGMDRVRHNCPYGERDLVGGKSSDKSNHIFNCEANPRKRACRYALQGCSQTFKGLNATTPLYNHIDRCRYNTEREAKCRYCSKAVHCAKIVYHEQSCPATGQEYECRHCGLRLRFLSNQSQHERRSAKRTSSDSGPASPGFLTKHRYQWADIIEEVRNVRDIKIVVFARCRRGKSVSCHFN